MAGAQGELAGVAMIMAYHRHRGDNERTEIIVPDAAHGTNPATASMCGCTVREIPTQSDGDIDVEALKKVLGPKTAGIMLTNPSTIGVFERRIVEIARLVHEAGGLLYYDGANLNAILGKVRPGDMGFDAIHMNLHKTFSTPHGGGGPGAGAVGVSERLKPYLPIPMIEKRADGTFGWVRKKDRPQSIGRLTTFAGNAGVLLRAYIYARLLGREGMRRVGEYATLNANYLAARACEEGFRSRLSEAPREPRVHRHGRQTEEGERRDRARFLQEPARSRHPRADELFPAARAGVPSDRADRNRKQGNARRIRRGHGRAALSSRRAIRRR